MLSQFGSDYRTASICQNSYCIFKNCTPKKGKF